MGGACWSSCSCEALRKHPHFHSLTKNVMKFVYTNGSTNMKRKDERSLQERANDLQKALEFSILVSIRKNYKSISNFKSVYQKIADGKQTSQQQVKFISLFSHTRDEYRKILGRIQDGSDYRRVSLKEVQSLLPSWLHLRSNFTKHYKSGKHYSVFSYWYMDFQKIEELWNCKDVYDLTSDLYTKEQHELIDRVILNGGKNKMAKHVNEKKEAFVEDIPIEVKEEPKKEPKRNDIDDMIDYAFEETKNAPKKQEDEDAWLTKRNEEIRAWREMKKAEEIPEPPPLSYDEMVSQVESIEL